MCETGTGQQVAQLRDRLMMMMMMGKWHTKESMIPPPQRLSGHHTTHTAPPPVQLYHIRIISGLHTSRIRVKGEG